MSVDPHAEALAHLEDLAQATKEIGRLENERIRIESQLKEQREKKMNAFNELYLLTDRTFHLRPGNHGYQERLTEFLLELWNRTRRQA